MDEKQEMIRLVYMVKKIFGRRYHTKGVKAGRSFADHFINVAFVSHKLAKILEETGFISNQDIRLAFYAGLVHDTNKIFDKSLRQSSTLEDIKEILKLLEVSENDFLFTQEALKTLQACISLHQESGLQGMELLFEKGELDQKTKLLSRIVKFADKFDNFQSADLQNDENLKKSCESVLQEISEITENSFQYTHLFYVALKEFRGFFTELIYENLDEFAVNEYNMIPIARFSNGTVYLSKEEIKFYKQSYENSLNRISDLLIHHKAFSSTIKESAVSFANVGIKLADCALDMDIRSLVNSVKKTAQSKEKYNEKAVFVQGIQRICEELSSLIPKKSPDKAELEKVFFELSGYNLNQNMGRKLEDIFKQISQLSPFVNSAETIEEFAERCINRLKPLYDRYKTGLISKYIKEYLKKYLVINGHSYVDQSQSIEDLAASFKNYGPHEQTCSVCGISANKNEMTMIKESESPNLNVQAFTNRMKAHVQKEPRRYVCQFCRLQFLATKAKGINHSDTQVLFVLLPGRYYPVEFLDQMEKMASQRTEDKNYKDYLEDMQLGTIFGKKLRALETVFGNMIYIPYSATKKELKKWQRVSVICCIQALLFNSRLPVRILVTSDVLLLQDDIEFNEEIVIKDIPAMAKRILLKPDLWKHFGELAQDSNLGDYLFELVGQPGELEVAAALAKRWNDIRPVEAVKEAFKIFGGDKMQEFRKMAELATSWAYKKSINKKPSDHKYLKPFVDAVEATRKFNPKLGEDEEDLKALLTEYVSRSVENEILQVKEFVDNFLSFLKKIGDSDIIRGRDILLKDFNKYRNLLLGNIKLLAYERISKAKEG